MARYMWEHKKAVWWAAAVACGALSSACMAEGLPPVVDEEGADRQSDDGPASLAEALGELSPLSVTDSSRQDRGSLIRVEAARSGVGEVGAESNKEVELSVLGGYIDVRALDQHTAAIRDFVIDIDDVELPSGLVSADVRFTGVRAQLVRPETFEITWGERNERAEAIVPLDLEVNWGVSIDGGEMHPLAPVKIEGLELVLELSRGDDGGVEAQIAGFREGVFYEWGGMVELRGLAVDVRAEEGAR